MDLMQAMKERRSVRSFTDEKIEGETLSHCIFGYDGSLRKVYKCEELHRARREEGRGL